MNSLRQCLRKFLEPRLELCKNDFKKYSYQATEVAEAGDLEAVRNTPTNVSQRILKFLPKYAVPREVWVENFDSITEEKRGLVELHPSIFGTMPRLDIIFENVRWQLLYRRVDKTHAKTRAEMRGSGRKPWQQKGLGKARQGSVRAPHFLKGGTAHGPRNPTSYFFEFPFQYRLKGLTSTLSAKFAQDDIHVVDNLEIPTDDPQFILDLMKERAWGSSVLLVDKEDIMPRNITAATDQIPEVNIMPVYGLNVFSMLKHETLVLSLSAVNEIEERLLTLLNYINDKELSKRDFKDYGIPHS